MLVCGTGACAPTCWNLVCCGHSDGTGAKHWLSSSVLSPSVLSPPVKWCPDLPSCSECSEMPKCQLPQGAYRDSVGTACSSRGPHGPPPRLLVIAPSPHLLPAAGALPGPSEDGQHPSLVRAVPAKESCCPSAPGVDAGTWLPCASRASEGPLLSFPRRRGRRALRGMEEVLLLSPLTRTPSSSLMVSWAAHVLSVVVREGWALCDEKRHSEAAPRALPALGGGWPWRSLLLPRQNAHRFRTEHGTVQDMGVGSLCGGVECNGNGREGGSCSNSAALDLAAGQLGILPRGRARICPCDSSRKRNGESCWACSVLVSKDRVSTCTHHLQESTHPRCSRFFVFFLQTLLSSLETARCK